ncbi:unnamed protein product, partial [marine sediment metagenome]
DYTIETSVGRSLCSMDFWSLPQDVVTIPVGPADPTLPNVSVAGLPDGATIERAIAMFKFRMVENDNIGANALNGDQVIQVAPDVPAINFVDNQFTIAAKTREGGDVVIGAIDIAATVNADAAYVFHWEAAQADVASLLFNDVQMGIRIWYSI